MDTLELINQLYDMGFAAEHTSRALDVLGPAVDAQAVLDWLLAHPVEEDGV